MNIPAHQLSMTVLMSPDMANFSGNVHGRAILKLLEAAALNAPLPDRHRVVFRGVVDGVEPLTPTVTAPDKLFRSCRDVLPPLKPTMALLPL